MKNKKVVWYLGYVIALILVIVIFTVELPALAEAALTMIFAGVLAVSYVQLLHGKMVAEDPEYRINLSDERSILIKEKSGNVTNMVTVILIGGAAVVFFALDYLVPAIVIGCIVFIQPFVLAVASNHFEKKM